MEENEIKEVLGRFNQYLNEHLWMDFELIEFSRGDLKIIGSIDISNKPNIELVFSDVFLPQHHLTGKLIPAKKSQCYYLEKTQKR